MKLTRHIGRSCGVIDEDGAPFPDEFQPSQWLGYGVLLGYLLARDELEGSR